MKDISKDLNLSLDLFHAVTLLMAEDLEISFIPVEGYPESVVLALRHKGRDKVYQARLWVDNFNGYCPSDIVKVYKKLLKEVNG
jgi:hypothetical protein